MAKVEVDVENSHWFRSESEMQEEGKGGVLKGKVTIEAEKIMDSNGVFASNTSTLPITGLAEKSIRPEKFIGIHFFSPVHKMKLVEIIKGDKTNDETIAKAFDYAVSYTHLTLPTNREV